MGNTVMCQLSGGRRRSSRRNKKKLHATGDAFLCSAEIGDERMMQALHSANQELELMQYRDISGQTALHYAAADGQLKCVEFLLASGCDLNIRDVWQRTPLMKAIVNKQREAAQFLIDHGCDVNLADSIKSSALHVAASYGDAGIVSLLIGADARVDAVDSKQRQPLYYAVLNSALDVVYLLLQRGAIACEYDQVALSVEPATDGRVAAPQAAVQPSSVIASATHGVRHARNRNRNREASRIEANRTALVLSGANVQLSPVQLAVYQLCRRTRANAHAAGAIERKANVVRALMADCVIELDCWLDWFETFSDRDASELCVHRLLQAAVLSSPASRALQRSADSSSAHRDRARMAAPTQVSVPQNVRLVHSRSFGESSVPRSDNSSNALLANSRSLHSLANQLATAQVTARLNDYLEKMRRLRHADELDDEVLRCASGRAVFSLKDLCRMRIRALLAHRNAATNIRPFVERLPIPSALNHFIRLHDLLDIACKH